MCVMKGRDRTRIGSLYACVRCRVCVCTGHVLLVMLYPFIPDIVLYLLAFVCMRIRKIANTTRRNMQRDHIKSKNLDVYANLYSIIHTFIH